MIATLNTYLQKPFIPSVETYYLNSFQRDSFTRILDSDIFQFKLPRILRACDRCSMAFSKELRVPFLDLNLLSLIRSFPPEYKIRGGLHRSFFIDAMRQHAPIWKDKDAYRKRHVADPQTIWFSSVLKEYVYDTLNSGMLEKFNIVSRNTIEIALKTFYNSRKPPNNSVFIWQLLCLETWLKELF